MIPPLEAMIGRFIGWKWLMSENVRCFVHKRENTNISRNLLYSHFCTVKPSDWIWSLRGYGLIFLFWLTLIFVQFNSGHFSESTSRWVEQSWEHKPVCAVSVMVDIVAEKGCAIFCSLPRAKLTKTFFCPLSPTMLHTTWTRPGLGQQFRHTSKSVWNPSWPAWSLDCSQ